MLHWRSHSLKHVPSMPEVRVYTGVKKKRKKIKEFRTNHKKKKEALTVSKRSADTTDACPLLKLLAHATPAANDPPSLAPLWPIRYYKRVLYKHRCSWTLEASIQFSTHLRKWLTYLGNWEDVLVMRSQTGGLRLARAGVFVIFFEDLIRTTCAEHASQLPRKLLHLFKCKYSTRGWYCLQVSWTLSLHFSLICKSMRSFYVSKFPLLDHPSSYLISRLHVTSKKIFARHLKEAGSSWIVAPNTGYIPTKLKGSYRHNQ